MMGPFFMGSSVQSAFWQFISINHRGDGLSRLTIPPDKLNLSYAL